MNETNSISITTLILPIIFFGLFSACTRPENEMDSGEDSADIQLPAMYNGVLPCADCPGIDYQLIIEDDGYTEISLYRDRPAGSFEKTGRWKINGDTLALFQSDHTVLKKFLFDEEKLRLLSSKNQKVQDDLTEQYVLERTADQASIRKHHQNLAAQGLTFFAGGNEPFWSVKVDSVKRIEFLTPESTRHFGKADSTENNNENYLQANTDSTRITIQAAQTYCQDSMSGYLFPQTVTVYLQTSETDTLTGCGLFLDNL